MRYFSTSNASRPYKAGGFEFSFDPTIQVGGVWSGVLAVAQDVAASALAGAGIPQIKEITAEEYESVKKKPSITSSLRELYSLPSKSDPPAAPRVEPAATSPSGLSTASPPSPIPKVTAKRVQVPDELISARPRR